MTKLAIFIIGIIMSLSPVYAQGTDQLLNLNLVHKCAPAEQVLSFLKEQYGETLFAVGRASVTITSGN